MLRLFRTFYLSRVALCSVLALVPAFAQESQTRGLIVAAIRSSGAAANAGIAAQDILHSWSTESGGGLLSSPFDIDALQTEQAPRGRVTLHGLSGNINRTWNIEPGASWGLDVIMPSGSPPMEPWDLLNAAIRLDSQHRWREADNAWTAAIAAGNSDNRVKSQIERIWADSLYKREQFGAAEKYYRLAINDLTRLEEKSLTLSALWDYVGRCLEHEGDLSQAKRSYDSALSIANSVERASLTTANAFNGLGRIARLMDDPALSRQQYLKALALQSTMAPNSLGMASVEHNLALIDIDTGDLEEAEQYTDEALAIRERLEPNSMLTAASYINRGNIAFRRNDFAASERWFLEAQERMNAAGPQSMVQATVLTNLATVASARWDLEGAEKYYRRATAMQERFAPESQQFASTLTGLASILEKRGKLDEAERDVTRALAIAKHSGPKLEATCLNVLGDILLHRGDSEHAAVKYHQSLDLISTHQSARSLVADNLYQLASLAAKRSNYSDALRDYSEALDLLRDIDQRGTAHVEFALASVYQRQGRTDTADELYKKAIGDLEIATAHSGGGEYSQAMFRERYESYLCQYIDLLIAEKRIASAFSVVEQFKARTLLEMIQRGGISITSGLPRQLIAEQSEIQRAITRKLAERVRLIQSGADQKAISKELDALLARYSETQAKIRDSDPAFAQVTQVTHGSLQEIQQALQSSTLLEFSLGDQHSYVFVITKTSISAHQLPNRQTINDACREFYAKIGSPDHLLSAADSREAARPLSKLLFDHVPNFELQSGTRMIVVGDGGLQYIPFSLLLGANAHWLLRDRELLYLPSASLLTLRGRSRHAHPKEALIVADPVYSSSDKRIAKPMLLAANSLPSTDGNSPLSRLFYSKEEASLIDSSFPPLSTAKLLGFDANRKTFLSADLTQFRILHFATHGIFDAERPALSGLLLSMVDRDGRPQNGVLGLTDIFNLKLNADLVVLNGCETALGQDMAREGMVGLTRGFMYAGAKQIIASLWVVDDEASAYFMSLFFSEMEQHHLLPSQALRAAQLKMASQERWSSPFYWGGFIIQGDWR